MMAISVTALLLGAAMLGGTPPAAAPTKDFLQDLADRANAAETAARREHYEYLAARGPQAETFGEYLAKYGTLATLGPPASPADVEALRALAPVALPDELVAFYRDVGAFRHGERVIHAPRELLAMRRAGAPRWQAIRSIGLVDMIRRSWGNDRPEFEPDSGEGLDAETVRQLDARYAVLGWRGTSTGEGFEYLFVDAAGRFGTLSFEQDDFDQLYEESLEPMLRRSPATLTLHEAIVQLFRHAREEPARD